MLKSMTLFASLALCACTSSSTAPSITKDSCPADTPAALAPAADQNLVHILDATGTQDYACMAMGTSYAWTLVGPDADLFELHDATTVVGHHSAGPTWSYKDGSSVVGMKVAASTVDPTAVAWLLLTETSQSGPGLMASITSIQRLETTGGMAPTTGCDASHVGATSNVPYTATYYFYATQGGQTASNIRCGG